MPEIKARGKTINTNEWVYGYLVKDWDNNTYIITKFGPDITYCNECGTNEITKYEVIPESVGLYTGVTDKNGIEIYEGDKVKGHNGINQVIGLVKFGEYEQDGSGGEYGPSHCIGFYVERLETIPNEWEDEECFYEPDYEETMSILSYENIEVLND